MKALPILFVLVLVSTVLSAEELPKFDVLRAGTKTYKGVKVTAVEPSGIRFTHENGAARAKFEDLEPEVRSKFTFDPAKAVEFEKSRAMERVVAATSAQEAKLNEELVKLAKKSQVRIEGTVQQITEHGLLLRGARLGKEREQAVQNYLGAWYKQVDWSTLPDDSAFVVCSTSGFVDGHRIDEVLYPRGTFEFTTVLGARRKVKCFTASLEDYLHYQRDPSYQPK